MERTGTFPRLIGIAVLTAAVGSLLGAALFSLYGLATFYWEMHQQFGEHMFDMGVMPPDFKTAFSYSAMFSLPLTIPTALIIGVPLVYGFRSRILKYPKTSILGFTVLWCALAMTLTMLLLGGGGLGGVGPVA